MGLVVAVGIANTRVPPGQQEPPEAARWIFFILGLCFFLAGSTLVVANLLVARRLQQRRSRVFCIVVAAVGCIFLPYGTLLGVCAMLVLCRPSVIALFGERPAAGGPGKAPTVSVGADGEGPAAIPAAPPALAPRVLVAGTGDATGGIIPYKNPHALIAYYSGVFSLIPCLGIILGPIAVGFGVSGLRARRRNPAVRGHVHAWAAIVLGSIVIAAHVLVGFAVANSIRSSHARPPAARFESRSHPRF